MGAVAPRTARAMAEHWTARADRFDGAASHLKAFDLWLELFRRILPSEPVDVLDLGTGTGACALLCASLGHHVTAVDGSSGMLDFARKQAQQRSLDIHFVQNTMDEADLPDVSADVVTLRNVLWTLEEPQEALRLAHRVLRPGGMIVVSDGLWRCAENRSAETFGAELPFVNGLHEDDVRGMLTEAGFGQATAWQQFLPTDLYGPMYDPGATESIRFFVVSARKPAV